MILAFIVWSRAVKVPIKNRHVLVTDGSSDIGFAIATQATAEGARVSILARNCAKLKGTCDTIRVATGVEVSILSANVRDATTVVHAVEEAGDIDVLVCSHGVFTPMEQDLQDLKEVRFMMEVNVMGTFHFIKVELPAMKRRGKKTGLAGSIAIVSSQARQMRFLGKSLNLFWVHKEKL